MDASMDASNAAIAEEELGVRLPAVPPTFPRLLLPALLCGGGAFTGLMAREVGTRARRGGGVLIYCLPYSFDH